MAGRGRGGGEKKEVEVEERLITHIKQVISNRVSTQTKMFR